MIDTDDAPAEDGSISVEETPGSDEDDITSVASTEVDDADADAQIEQPGSEATQETGEPIIQPVNGTVIETEDATETSETPIADQAPEPTATSVPATQPAPPTEATIEELPEDATEEPNELIIDPSDRTPGDDEVQTPADADDSEVIQQIDRDSATGEAEDDNSDDTSGSGGGDESEGDDNDDESESGDNDGDDRSGSDNGDDGEGEAQTIEPIGGIEATEDSGGDTADEEESVDDDSGTEGSSDGDTGDDSSGRGSGSDDDDEVQQIEPVAEIEATEGSGDASADGDLPANTPPSGQGGDAGDAASGTGQDLGTAQQVGDLASIPGDPGGRLHIDQSGQLSFSGTPGGVTFERDGLALEQREVDTGASVFVCDDSGNCIDATSASADGFHTDYPLGWLGSEFLYERVGEDGEVSFRAVQLAEGSLEVIEDRLIASGGIGLETLTRSYPVEGGLLVPAPDAWLLISTEGVSQIDDNPYGGDISRIRTAPAANTIAYVAQGQIVIASLSSPGTPEAVIPFTGNEYALAPDGSRVAVTDGSTIQILDRTGRVVESFDNEAGVSIGSIAWGNDGIVFVDQSNGVLRKIDPAGQ